MKKIFFFFIFLASIILRGQKDTIFKKDGSLITCTITLINNKNIFYDLKRIQGNYISFEEIKEYSQKGKRGNSPVIEAVVIPSLTIQPVKKGPTRKITDSATVFVIRANTGFGGSLGKFNIKLNGKEGGDLKNGEAIKCVFYNEGDLKILSTLIFKDKARNYQVINLDIKFSKIYYIACSYNGGETKLVDEAIGEALLPLSFSYIFKDDIDNPIIKSPFSKGPRTGTGFLFSQNGLIVTNHHVIENATKIDVKGINGDFTTTYSAKVIADDVKNDLAILQFENKTIKFDSIPYTIRTKAADTGEDIYVLGYPMISAMGEEIKLTTGIISSKSGYQGDITSYQVSAPVQGGNSGGPMFDKNGNLTGIINAKIFGAEGVTYAIKVNYFNSLMEQLPSPPFLSATNKLNGLSLQEQVKLLSKFIYIIKVSN
jgi:S1-C subfamily serine protease